MPRYSAESAYGDSKGGIYTPSFVASSDDEDENEMMFTGEEDYNYNTGSSGRGDNVVDVNILHSLLTEDDDISTDAKNNNSAIMPPSGLDKLFTEELKHYSNIDTMEEAEHDTKATYVLHYKQMMRQQELEGMATVAHLLPLFKQIRDLGYCEKECSSDDYHHNNNYVSSNVIQQKEVGRDNTSSEELTILSYDQMKRALRTLECSKSGSSQEIIKTDNQLLMTLHELVSMSTRYHDDQNKPSFGLTFPEFLQCYRVVVSGMQTLEMLPNTMPNTTTNSNYNTMNDGVTQTKSALRIQKLRATTTSRVMAMIRTFAIAAEEVNSNNSGGSYRNTSTSAVDTIIAAAEMRSILTAKDQQFAEMLRTHEDEMDDLACQINNMNIQHRRRYFAICSFWILCCIASIVFVSRGGARTSSIATFTPNISTPINNIQNIKQPPADRLTVESILEELSDGLPITDIQLKVLQEFYRKATGIEDQFNKSNNPTTICYPEGTLNESISDVSRDDRWRRQADASILQTNETQPKAVDYSDNRQFSKVNNNNSSNETSFLILVQHPPTLVQRVSSNIFKKSNLPIFAAAGTFGGIVTSIAFNHPDSISKPCGRSLFWATPCIGILLLYSIPFLSLLIYYGVLVNSQYNELASVY